MAHSLRSESRHRANGALAYHVLDTMHAILNAAESGGRVEIESTCLRPAPCQPG